jgi:hypothetical protein
MSDPAKIEDIRGVLYRATCIVRYVADNEIDKDRTGTGEALKSAEELILQAIDHLGLHA